MKENFLRYEHALVIKKLGFDEDCFGKYYGKITNITKPLIYEFTFANLPRVENSVNYPDYPYQDVEAPLYQQGFRFFRDIFKLEGIVEKCEDFSTFKYVIKKYVSEHNKVFITGEYEFKTYEDAEYTCIDTLIKMSIK